MLKDKEERDAKEKAAKEAAAKRRRRGPLSAEEKAKRLAEMSSNATQADESKVAPAAATAPPTHPHACANNVPAQLMRVGLGSHRTNGWQHGIRWMMRSTGKRRASTPATVHSLRTSSPRRTRHHNPHNTRTHYRCWPSRILLRPCRLAFCTSAGTARRWRRTLATRLTGGRTCGSPKQMRSDEDVVNGGIATNGSVTANIRLLDSAEGSVLFPLSSACLLKALLV